MVKGGEIVNDIESEKKYIDITKLNLCFKVLKDYFGNSEDIQIRMGKIRNKLSEIELANVGLYERKKKELERELEQLDYQFKIAKQIEEIIRLENELQNELKK